jgi:hypothetical protein
MRNASRTTVEPEAGGVAEAGAGAGAVEANEAEAGLTIEADASSRGAKPEAAWISATILGA